PYHLNSFPTRRSSDLSLERDVELNPQNYSADSLKAATKGLNKDEAVKLYQTYTTALAQRRAWAEDPYHPMQNPVFSSRKQMIGQDRKSTRLNSSHGSI